MASRAHVVVDCAAYFALMQEAMLAARHEQMKLWVEKIAANNARAPRGYAADHVAVEDLKRKDFIALAPLSFDDVTGAGLVKLAGTRFAEAAPLMRFLCEALNVPY